jgi:ribosomal protein S18 acetylase RimI-like enzyme
MDLDQLKDIIVSPLRKGEPIPYHLLLDADPFEGALNRYLGFSEIFVALSGDAIVGVYVLYPIDFETSEIKNIAVEEKLQNMGVGKMLLQDAARKTKENGVRKLVIGTSNASIAQLYLYQSQGFKFTGIKKDFFLENYSEPLFENGIQCRHMFMLAMQL